MGNIVFDVKYYTRGEFTHKYTESWSFAEYFCPCCSRYSVYVDNGPGDYYVGEGYVCIDCGASFYMPGGADVFENEQDAQRVQNIRKEVGWEGNNG